MGRLFSRDIEADIACAIEPFSFVTAIFALDLHPAAHKHPDALGLVIVLWPYDVRKLVQTHYAVLLATATHDVTGRILYVNGEATPPGPLAHAHRIVPTSIERARARRRVEMRRALACRGEIQLADVERAFNQLAAQAARDVPPSQLDPAAPYRPLPPAAHRGALSGEELEEARDTAFGVTSIAAPLTMKGVLEIVADPFPAEKRRRVLIADDDPVTERAVASLTDCDVVLVRDGWSAIDHLVSGNFALALCAVALGDLTGAKIFRLVVTERPDMASRFAFLAEETAIEQAPPSTMKARVLRRPLDPSAVRALLDG